MPEPKPDRLEFSDDALALRFADLHGHSLRFIANRGVWMSWTDNGVWLPAMREIVIGLVREFLRTEAPKCDDERRRNWILSGQTVAVIERLARSDQRILIPCLEEAATRWLTSFKAAMPTMDGAELSRVWVLPDVKLFRSSMWKFPAVVDEFQEVAAVVQVRAAPGA